MYTKRITCLRCGLEALRYTTARADICEPCMKSRRLERLAATAEVSKAVRKGRLPSPKSLACADCSGPARDYDHRDYTLPLAVEPVCHSCNLRRGTAFDSAYRPAGDSSAKGLRVHAASLFRSPETANPSRP